LPRDIAAYPVLQILQPRRFNPRQAGTISDAAVFIPIDAALLAIEPGCLSRSQLILRDPALASCVSFAQWTAASDRPKFTIYHSPTSSE